MSDSKRFKVTTDAGRVFYVYAPSIGRATVTFRTSPEGAGVGFNVEQDVGKWKTTLQDGRTVFGG